MLRPALVPGLALALGSAGYAGLAAFAVLHLDQRGSGSGVVVLSCFSAVYAGTRLFIGDFPDKYGARRVAIWSGPESALGLLTVAAAPNLPVAVSAASSWVSASPCWTGRWPCGAGPRRPARRVRRSAPTPRSGTSKVAGGPLLGVVASGFGYPAVFVAGRRSVPPRRGRSPSIPVGRSRSPSSERKQEPVPPHEDPLHHRMVPQRQHDHRERPQRGAGGLPRRRDPLPVEERRGPGREQLVRLRPAPHRVRAVVEGPAEGRPAGCPVEAHAAQVVGRQRAHCPHPAHLAGARHGLDVPDPCARRPDDPHLPLRRRAPAPGSSSTPPRSRARPHCSPICTGSNPISSTSYGTRGPSPGRGAWIRSTATRMPAGTSTAYWRGFNTAARAARRYPERSMCCATRISSPTLRARSDGSCACRSRPGRESGARPRNRVAHQPHRNRQPRPFPHRRHDHPRHPTTRGKPVFRRPPSWPPPRCRGR